MAAISFDVQLWVQPTKEMSLKLRPGLSIPMGASDWPGSFRYVIRNLAGRWRGHFKFVCTNLDTGKAVRMPQIFKETYVMVSEPVVSV